MDFSPKNLIKILESKGYYLKRITGSHHIYYNEQSKKMVPIPKHANKDIAKGTFFTILKQAGIDKNEI